MKKFLASFLVMLYFVFANAGLALADNLYFVKNSSPDKIKSSIVSILNDKNYIVKKQDPYYAVSKKNNSDYVVIIFQKSSNNYFYYIDSNNTGVNKSILKAIKNTNATYEESFNTQYFSMFENQAAKIMCGSEGIYSFESANVQPVTTVPQVQPKKDDNVLRGSIIQIVKGTTLKAFLETPINTADAEVGDEVRAILSENWIYKGQVVAPQGSILIGKLSKARHASLGSRNGQVIFDFNTLSMPDGKLYSISTENIDFTVTNEGKWKKTAGKLVAGAVVGLLTGVIIGACTKDTNRMTTAAISAGAGMAAGAVGAAIESGIDAEIPVYTELEISLSKPFSVVANY